MTDKLSIEEITQYAEGKKICFKHSSMALAGQLIDAMRENERLLAGYKKLRNVIV